MGNPDKIILDQLKEGNADAYESLFKRYYKLLCMQAYYIIESESESEDVVQLLFAEIWEKQLYNNINSSLKAYLQTSVRNKCIKIIDKRKLEQQSMEMFSYHMSQVEEVDIYEQQNSEGIINAILNGLPRQRQQAFTLVYIEEKKYKEAADEMGISVNSVKSHLRIAMKELRQKITNLK